MRLHTFSLLCSALFVLSVDVVAAQSTLPLDGTWEGTLVEGRSTGSREVRQRPPSRVVAQLSTSSDGRYVGVWLITSTTRIADIGEVTIDGDAVRIGVPSSRGIWEGKLSADGSTLAGEWRQGGKARPLVFRRTGDANEPVRFGVFSPGTVSPR